MADEVEQAFRVRECLANQTTYPLAQGEVEPLDVVGLSLLLLTRLVLIFGKNLFVGVPKVAIAHLLFVGLWHLGPQELTTHLISRSIVPSDHLASPSAYRQPDPHLVLLAGDVTPHFIQLQHIVGLCLNQSRFQVRRPGLALLFQQLLVFF